VKAEHIWLMPDTGEDGYEPLAIAGPSTLTYVHGDHLGAPSLLTDGTGAVVNRYDASPFGQRWASLAASPTTALAFPGQLIDAADRHYNLHRDYDPTLGRYLQADPIGLAGGDNPYAYAQGNPLSRIDPDGRIPLLAIVPAVWAGFELFSSAYDIYDAYRTVRDPCSTSRDKAISVAGAAIGIFAPGGGYGVVAKDAASGGKAVLGHFPEYKRLGDSLNARTFSIPDAIWNKMSDAQRWAANQKFLDRMISRGDDIILATPLDRVRPGSYFARELEYMGSKGYVPSADGTLLIKR
jgi:RHS repeat-associated protein